MTREKTKSSIRTILSGIGMLYWLLLPLDSVHAQYYQDNYYQDPYSSYGAGEEGAYRTPDPRQAPRARQYPDPAATDGLQYDQRDAEGILRDQVRRTRQQATLPQQSPPPQQAVPPQESVYGQEGYEDYYGHRPQTREAVARVMDEARSVGSLIRKRNGKAFIVIDKRNFQFYLYDRGGSLLRIGPVAIGKGKTRVGAFETPVGVFPIKSKIPVDDWIRPDWYFIEEREPIPKRWEDRRVPGFFRYKMVYEGARYIHYAEATGGRLTHGCLGLDWLDAEAVFHTLDVGSYCVIIDDPFLTRLAKGEFPVQTATPKPAKPESGPETVAVRIERETGRSEVSGTGGRTGAEDKVFRSLW